MQTKKSPIRFQVEQEGPRFTVTDGTDTISLQVSEPVTPVSHDFALWLMLPVAMSQGRDLVIAGGGDPLAARHAEEIARIWAYWLPHRYAPIKATFERDLVAPPAPANSPDLVLYSGGVDSTHNLLHRHRQELRHSLLTLQGLDYKPGDDARFQGLLDKTNPFARHVGGHRIFLGTNAYQVYEKYETRGDISHPFVLASGLFLFAGRFREGVISADRAAFQDPMSHPWGTNAIINPLFRSQNFRMATADLDLTRADKLGLIAESDVALQALSFCVDYSCRPLNCGVCSKCSRTKAMFLARNGKVPAIFKTDGLAPDALRSMDFSRRYEITQFLTLYYTAHRHGNAALIPGLEEKFQELLRMRREADALGNPGMSPARVLEENARLNNEITALTAEIGNLRNWINRPRRSWHTLWLKKRRKHQSA